MPCAHYSKHRACVRVKRLRMRDEDLTAICDRTKKKKTKPEFQLGRSLWRARVITTFHPNLLQGGKREADREVQYV